jgi:hypothetical protein
MYRTTKDQGVDCNDMVTLSGLIMYNLEIPFYIRITKVNQDNFQHVYLVILIEGKYLSGSNFTLDGVLSELNF